MQYIETALVLLNEIELLNSLEIKPVGEKGNKGDQDGGKGGLKNVKTFYKRHPSLQNQPILLLYDWDAGKTDESYEKLWIRSMPKNPDDTVKKPGTETLFSLHLFEDRFYDEELKEGFHGRNRVDPKFKKKEFCQWICEEQRNPDDFEKFKDVVKILKEFVEAAQQPPTQQPPSE